MRTKSRTLIDHSPAVMNADIQDPCPDLSIKAISKVLTNIYLAVGDDCEVNYGQISDTFKESIIAMAIEYMETKNHYSSFTNRDIPSILAPLDRAAEGIITGRTVDLSDEEGNRYYIGS